jgi:hypothetical protein
VGTAWNDLVNIVYQERNDDGDLDSPQSNQYWYIPSEQVFYRRNSGNTAWIELEFTLAVSDPTVRVSCDLWWNSSPSIDDLYIWDERNTDWILAGSFVQSDVAPSDPPKIPDNSVWLNPDTGDMQLLTSPDCAYKDVEYIDYPTDPHDIAYDIGWLDSDDVFKISDGLGGWIIIDPIMSNTDPYLVILDTFWYDQTNDLLKQWNGSAWVVVPTRATKFYPVVDSLVLNDGDELLYMWTGTTWILGDPIAVATLINPNKPDVANKISFATTATGCTQSIYILVEEANLFTLLSTSVVYYEPTDGASRLEHGPTWNALHIGDDGSPDERRQLHTLIRARLGYPTQKVELTDDQIDEAINSALQLVRKYSGYGYHREYFFLDLKPNQQRYVLTNKCVGFNKVSSINYLYRLRSGFLNGNTTAGGYDIYGYAALQHLYTSGTFDMLSYHLVSSYIEDMQIMFADHITFDWNETHRQLRIYHAVYHHERVLLDTYIERTEQDLFTNRETREWIKRWAVAESKVILSQIRGKFQTLPGPQGSTTLNSQELITQGETEKAELMEELHDPAMQNLQEGGAGSHFIFG